MSSLPSCRADSGIAAAAKGNEELLISSLPSCPAVGS